MPFSQTVATSLAALIQALSPGASGSGLQPCTPPFELRVPFREASVWQDYDGGAESTLELETGADGSSTQGFHVVLNQFVPQPTDTWFVYGLHGDLEQGIAYPQWNGRHAGIDFVAVPGLRVTAAADGRVSFAGDIPGFGGTVVVDHEGGFSTTYAELGAITVRPGERVYVGDEVGRITGKGTIAKFFHFGLDRSEGDGSTTAVNPLRYLDLSGAIVPRTGANQFAAGLVGSTDPAKQPDFSWDRRRFLGV